MDASAGTASPRMSLSCLLCRRLSTEAAVLLAGSGCPRAVMLTACRSRPRCLRLLRLSLDCGLARTKFAEDCSACWHCRVVC